MNGCSNPSGWMATSPSISRSDLFNSSMKAAVRCPAASNCSQNWRIAVVASLGLSSLTKASPSLKSPTALAAGTKPGEKERIAANVSGDVHRRVVRPSVIAEEHIDALVEAHQRHRNRVLADREDDRIMALHEREFVDG